MGHGGDRSGAEGAGEGDEGAGTHLTFGVTKLVKFVARVEIMFKVTGSQRNNF